MIGCGRESSQLEGCYTTRSSGDQGKQCQNRSDAHSGMIWRGSSFAMFAANGAFDSSGSF